MKKIRSFLPLLVILFIVSGFQYEAHGQVQGQMEWQGHLSRNSSVKAALAKEFGIDESWMETDGKGEGEPIDKANTPAGKANNRRVKFIKM